LIDLRRLFYAAHALPLLSCSPFTEYIGTGS
jgi:hypothetical protein